MGQRMLHAALCYKNLQLLFYDGAICPDIAYSLLELIEIAYLRSSSCMVLEQGTPPGGYHCSGSVWPLAKFWLVLIT